MLRCRRAEKTEASFREVTICRFHEFQQECQKVKCAKSRASTLISVGRLAANVHWTPTAKQFDVDYFT